jgi:hypothetical protein
MANHGKTGPVLEKYRAKKQLHAVKHPSKSLDKRREVRTKKFAAKAEAIKKAQAEAKEAAEFAALVAAEQKTV